ncbi:MAG: NusG domain II-containing protein [Eubacteriaceae bacterium]|nr:NusG domain II-containing protein [Eubacteriaceae bacterium]
MKRKDLIFISMVLVIALISVAAVYFYKGNSAAYKVVISVDGEVYKEIPLMEDTNETVIVDNDYGRNEIKITSTYAKMIEADCPDQICVYSANAEETGDMIVCLPHKLIVEVVKN